MENKKYLSEDNYQKVVKNLSKVSIIILILGFLLGGGLIGYGFVKSNEDKVDIVEEKKEEKSESEIQLEIVTLEGEVAALDAKQREEFDLNGFSEEFYRLGNEREKKELKVANLNVGNFDTLDAFDSFKRESEEIKSNIKVAPYYMYGSFIIFSSIVVSFMVFLFSRRREISAFSVQQSMPVAKEGLEKMAPTFGEVGKEIAKGVSEGLKESSREE